MTEKQASSEIAGKSMNKSEIAEEAAREIRRHFDEDFDTTIAGAVFDRDLVLIVERAIAESRSPEPEAERAARREAFKEVETFIAGNGRDADIQSFVEKKICGLERAKSEDALLPNPPKGNENV